MAFPSPTGSQLFATSSVSAFSDLENIARDLDFERQLNFTLLGELTASQSRIQHLEARLLELHPRGLPRVGSSSSLLSTEAPSRWSRIQSAEDLLGLKDKEAEAVCDCAPEAMVGKYTLSERQVKIQRYKAKQERYRQRASISRCFPGRSRSARKKLRDKGRFVKAAQST